MNKDNVIGRTYADYLFLRKGLVASNVVLAIVAFLAFVFALTRDEVVVMVPPNLSEEAYITNGQGNAEYQKRFALPVAMMMGNVNAQNVDFVMDQLATMMSPAIRSGIGVQIKNEARMLKARKLEQSFIVQDMMYSPQKDLVWVWGEKQIIGGSVKVDEIFTYVFRFEAENGFPRMTFFDSHKGAPSVRTLKKGGNRVETQYYSDDQQPLVEKLKVEKVNSQKLGENDED